MEENKLVKWFENFFDDKSNEEYLYLIDFNDADVKNLKNHNVKFIDLENFHEYISKNNYILYNKFTTNSKNNNMSSANWIRLKNDIKIICVKYDEAMYNAINSKNINIIKECEYHFIEKIDFKEILEMHDIYYFLKERNLGIYSLLGYEIIPLDKIERLYKVQIELFKVQKILTADLANKIYVLLQLDFCCNTTNIGNNIRKILNVKSKSITYKRLIEYLDKVSILYKGTIPIKQIRVYDLNINQYVLDTKINILKKLIKLNIDILDFKKIFEIIELSNIEIKEIKDSELKSYIKRFKSSNTIN